MPIPDRIDVEVVDASGDPGKTGFYTPSTFTLAQLNEASPIIASNVDGALDGQVTGVRLTREASVATLTGNTAAASSDVSRVGAFEFVSVDGFPVEVKIPALDESLVAASSDDINQSAPAVAAFLSAMLVGIAVTGGTIIPCDHWESDLVATVMSAERSKRRGKRG